MKKHTLLLFLLGFLGVAVQAQTMPGIDSTDFSGIEITKTRHFDGSSLYGYINGGAELYREYGFEHLRVQEIRWHNLDLTVSIYQMSDPMAAFGIFSVSIFQCDAQAGAPDFWNDSPYQVQFAAGNFYVSVVNQIGSGQAIGLMHKLAKKVKQKIKPVSVKMPRLFEQEPFNKFSYQTKLVKGDLGFQNKLADWGQNFQALAAGYTAFVLPIEQQTGFFYLACIETPKAKQLRNFFKEKGIDKARRKKLFLQKQDKHTTGFWRKNRKTFVFFQTNFSGEKLKKYTEVFEK